jgi:ABC-2 type transport system ATP-binding protein
VILLERGRKIAAGSLHDVAKGMQAHRVVRVRVLGPTTAAEEFLLAQPDVARVQASDAEVAFDCTGDDEALAALLARALAAGLRVVEFKVDSASLEDIFLHMTEGRLQ